MEIVFVTGLLDFIAAIKLKNAKEGTGWGFDEYYVLTAGGAASGRCD